MHAFINQIGTATPENDVNEAFAHVVPKMLSDPRERKLFQRLAVRSGIAHRYSTLKPVISDTSYVEDGFFRPGAFPSTAERMARFEREAGGVVDKALEDLNQRLDGDFRDGLTHIIVATCTGFAAPWIETQLIAKHGIDPTVERVLIGFMGCNASINAYKSARHFVRSDPKSRVLVINVELCTLHFQEDMPLEAALTFMLFADGASAALISADSEGLQMDSFASGIAPDSAELITWHIGDSGFDMRLAASVPRVISQNAATFIKDRCGPIESFGLWAVHPGGSAILDAMARSCSLSEPLMEDSRRVLHDYGNMSSATLPFVLQRQLNAPSSGRKGVAIGFGPGISIESMCFQEAAA